MHWFWIFNRKTCKSWWSFCLRVNIWVSLGNVDCPCRNERVSVSYYHIPNLLAHIDLLSTFLTEMCKSWRSICNVLLLEMWLQINMYCLCGDWWCVCVFVCPYYRSFSFLLTVKFITEKHAIPEGVFVCLSLSLSLSVSMFSANNISLMTHNSKINVNKPFFFMPETIQEREGETMWRLMNLSE